MGFPAHRPVRGCGHLLHGRGL